MNKEKGSWRRLAAKTGGWALISGIIFFTCAVWKDCPLEAAVFATLIATVSKTPAYPLWEMAFDKMWGKPKPAPVLCRCCQQPVEQRLAA